MRQATFRDLVLLALALGLCLGLGMLLGGCATTPSIWVLQSADPPYTRCPVCNAQEIQPVGQTISYNAAKTVKTSVVYWQCQSYLCGAVSTTTNIYVLRQTVRRFTAHRP